MCLSSISPVGPTYSILTLQFDADPTRETTCPVDDANHGVKTKTKGRGGKLQKVACLGSEKISQLGTWECRVSRQKSRPFTLSSSTCMGKQSLRGYAEFYSQTSDPKLHPCDRHVLGSKWLNRSLRWRMETK